MNYDQNLRDAMDDIRKILKRRNIAGHVILASPTNAEFALLYDIPSWSAITFEPLAGGRMGMRIKAKAKSDAAEKEKLDATVHMIWSFQDIIANGFMALDGVKKMLSEHIEVDHRSLVGREPDA